MISRNLSFKQHAQRLWLRSHGCLVEYPPISQGGLRLRIEMFPTNFETNFYPVPGGTAIIFGLEIRAITDITIHQLWFYCPWVEGFSLLGLSERRENYYCLPPGLWIASSEVLNHKLSDWRHLQRNQCWKGFVLGTIPHAIPATVGEQLEVVFGIEDLQGYEHSLVMTLTSRPLDSKLLRDYGEQATFPPPKKRKKKTIATAKPPTVLAADQPTASNET